MMGYGEAIKMALVSLRTNKMRSLLTLLGVIIGIAAVITILTLGAGLKANTVGALNSSGATDLAVGLEMRMDKYDPNSSNAGQMGGDPEDSDKISQQTVKDLREQFGDRLFGVSVTGWNSYPGSLAPMPDDPDVVEQSDPMQGSGDEWLEGPPLDPDAPPSLFVNVNSADQDTFKLRGQTMIAGSAFTESDVEDERSLIIVPKKYVDQFYQGNAAVAIGKQVQYDGSGQEIFTISGVYAPPETNFLLGSFEPEYAYLPYTVLNAMIGNTNTFNEISVRPAATEQVDQFARELQDFFDDVYASNENFRVKVRDFGQEMAEFNKVLTGISLVIAAIAGISLLVGGIGIMNIMLVTVTERTREIGVRKALGATRSAIRRQFVTEAMIICFIGGFIGVLLGTTFGMIGASFLNVVVFPPLWGVVGSLLFSVAIGLFFGYYPANKAAKLHPIEALRHE